MLAIIITTIVEVLADSRALQMSHFLEGFADAFGANITL